MNGKQIYNWLNMNTEGNRIFTSCSSAFQPLIIKTQSFSELEAYVDQLINDKKKIELLKISQTDTTKHPFVRLIDIMIKSIKKELFPSYMANEQQMISETSMELLKKLAAMVSQGLFSTQQKYVQELQSMLLFQHHLLQVFKRAFFYSRSDNPNVNLDILHQILNSLSESHYKADYVSNIFKMLGGSYLGLDKANFQKSLYFIIWNIGKLFTSKNKFITRNVKNMKKTKNVNQILNCSIKIICSYQNKQYIDSEIDKVSQIIFGCQNFLTEDQFVTKMKEIEKNSSSYMIWLFLDLLRAENLILQDSQMEQKINIRKDVEQSNFYSHQMQKLFNKCPYNGDERCNCKKCLCVRRNRESAKLSQEKKRNAIEQLDPLKKKIEELERRNKELEQQNTILKGIFNEIKDKKGFKQIMSATLDPISKVLND